jgi:hypothetical protein
MKEMRSLWFEKALLIFLIWSFSFGLYESARSQSAELRSASLAVVDEDRSPLSQRLSGALRPPELLPPKLIGFADVDPGLDAGLYTSTLHVPADFQRDVLAGKRPAIQLNIDATRMNEAFIGAGYFHNIVTDEVTRFVQGYRGDPPLPIRLATRMQYNPNLNGVWYFGAMELVNNITFMSIIAAVRAADDPGGDTLADAVRQRQRTDREHAARGADRHAGRADYALRGRGPGGVVPRRRAGRGMAATAGQCSYWHDVLSRRADAVPAYYGAWMKGVDGQCRFVLTSQGSHDGRDSSSHGRGDPHWGHPGDLHHQLPARAELAQSAVEPSAQTIGSP